MHTNLAALPDDAARVGEADQADDTAVSKPDDECILGPIYDLFAGRITRAYGEDLEWWAETFSDIGAVTMGQVALVCMSSWPFDRKRGEPGIAELKTELVKRARQLLTNMTAEDLEVLQ
ncbi:hypothetical protein BOTU111921_11305 [Bordetella tumbae]|uniref:hypothetical protein n=1 Tax=Bordetella tumbae TaxID=1649139 RepID=UPI0039EFCFE3